MAKFKPSQRDAATLFMRAVLKIKPKILEDLRDNVRVQPVERKAGIVTIRSRFPPDLIAWGTRSKVASSRSILKCAQGILRFWAERHPRYWHKLALPEPAVTPRPLLWDSDPLGPNDPPLIGAQPSVENLRQFVARAREHYHARERADRRSRKGFKLQPEHFEWLARRLWFDHSDDDIASTAGYPLTKDAVRKGITSAARVLQLRLEPRPVGRPRQR